MEPEEQKKAVGQAAMVLVDESRRAAAASTSCLDDPLERGSVAQSHLLSPLLLSTTLSSRQVNVNVANTTIMDRSRQASRDGIDPLCPALAPLLDRGTSAEQPAVARMRRY